MIDFTITARTQEACEETDQGHPWSCTDLMAKGRVYQKLPLISTALNVIFPQLFLTSSFANAGPSSHEDCF